MKRVSDVTLDEFAAADAVAFGAPNTFGSMAGALREFFIGLGVSVRAPRGSPRRFSLPRTRGRPTPGRTLRGSSDSTR